MIRINLFSYRLIARVLILVMLCLVFGKIFWDENWIFNQFILLALIVLLSIDILRVVQGTNRKIERLLESINYHEFSSSTLSGDVQLAGLEKQLLAVQSKYKSWQNELESKQSSMKSVLEEIGTGILLFDEDGVIQIQNQAFSNLMNIGRMKELAEMDQFFPGLRMKIQALQDREQFMLQAHEYNFQMDGNIPCTILKWKTQGKENTLIILNQYSESTDAGFNALMNYSKVLSHEINNGITPISSISESLIQLIERNQELEVDTKSKITDALQVIQKKSSEMIQFTDKYQELSRIPAPNFEFTTWQRIFDKVYSDNKTLLDEHHIEWKMNPHNLDKSIKADPIQLSHCFDNLIINSIHALKGKESKFISIEIKELNHEFLVFFSDNGIGIPEEHRSKIFLPFFSTRDTGSGIGLSLCRQILWKQAAKIQLVNGNVGASFVIKWKK